MTGEAIQRTGEAIQIQRTEEAKKRTEEQEKKSQNRGKKGIRKRKDRARQRTEGQRQRQSMDLGNQFIFAYASKVLNSTCLGTLYIRKTIKLIAMFMAQGIGKVSKVTK